MTALSSHLIIIITLALKSQCQIDFADNSLFSVFGRTRSINQTNESSSYNVSSKNDFAACTCDITANSCDLFCCCDTLCPSNMISTWKNQNACIDVSPDQLIHDLSDCLEKREKATQDELRYPLQAIVINLRLLFCKVRDNTDSKYVYLSSLKLAQNESQYNDLLDTSLKVQLSSSIKPQSTSFTTRQNYIVGDNVLGQFQGNIQTGNKVFFPKASSSGACQGRGQNIVFGRNVQRFRCTKTLAADCSNQFDEVTIKPISNPSSLSVSLTPGTLQSVNTSTLVISDIIPSTFPAKDCSNVLIQGEYVITYDEENKITSFQLNGKYRDYSGLGGSRKIKQSFSLRFVSSTTQGIDFQKSGNPGYIRGMPLLMGKLNSDQVISLQTEGFQLYANNISGQCITGNPPLSATNLFLENPTITFEQDLIYGCMIKKNFDDLQTFCSGTQRPLLFQNLMNQGKYIGKFGNSNPSFPLDWVEVQNVGQPTSSSFTGGVCTISAGGKLEIYVSKLGNSDKVQYQVVKADFQYQTMQWSFNKPKKTDVQTFNYILTITFYQIPQTAQNFTAETPVLAVELPKESLYPFIIQSGSYLQSGLQGLILLFILLIGADE